MELKASRKQRERAQLEGKDGGLGSSPEASEQQQQNRNRRRTINAGSRVRARERTGGASGGLGPKPGHLTGKKAGRRAGWPGPARGWGRSHFPQNTILNSLSIERNTIPPKFLVFFFFFFFNLFLAVLGLRFCTRALSSCGKRGPLFIAVRGPLTVAASPAAEHRLQTRRLSSCGSRAQLLRGTWDPPRPGLEPVSPLLAGRLSTTAPPGTPPRYF